MEISDLDLDKIDIGQIIKKIVNPSVCIEHECTNNRSTKPKSPYCSIHRHPAEKRRNPERFKERQDKYWLNRMGLTLEQKKLLWDAQKQCCAICSKPIAFSGRNTHIDHNHLCCPHGSACSACVRGLLCSSCNNRVLPVVENKDLLAAALRYLENYQLQKPQDS